MIGKTISHYRILEEIGSGGMGVVYKAEDTKLGRIVALKFLRSDLVGTGAERERFSLEARAAAALDHPNICTVYEVDTVGDQTFIAMAYIEGESLESRIEKGPLPLDDSLRYAIGVCEALAEAHAKNVIHRDIKPANIMISRKDRPILMDFGLAKLAGRPKLTRDGSTLGTVHYMSPEQARGEEVDHRSDIWSLAVVLYQMIAGRPPFRGSHDSAILYSIMNEDPEPLTALRSGVPMELERIVVKAMAKDRDARYQHVDDLRVDLLNAQRSLAEGKPSAARPSVAAPQSSEPASRARPRLRHAAGLLVIAAAVVAAIWLWPRKAGIESERSAGPPAGDAAAVRETYQNSIAVLPLGNLSRDAENEFFADGMTEELITQLAGIKALKVISRTSIMRFKGTDKSLREIAGELDVATILEGSVLWAGDRVRISVQLIDGATDRHLWAQSYESDLSDVLGLQRRVAGEVAQEIQVELTAGERERFTASPVVNREAYELYLQGRFHWNRRTPEGIQKAIGFYEQALGIDPQCVLAYTGLAESYAVLPTWAYNVRSADAYRRAREMAEKALSLDPNVGPAHAVLGVIAETYDWDRAAAARYLKRAVELSPNDANARQWHAEFLARDGRRKEAAAEMRVALELDPLSLIVGAVAGWVLAANGEFDAADAQFQKVFSLDPEFASGYLMQSIACQFMAKPDRAASASVRYLELTATTDRLREGAVAVRRALEHDGIDAFYRDITTVLEQNRRDGYLVSYFIAHYQAQQRQTDSVMVWLERGYRDREPMMPAISVDPVFDFMHSDPRFVDLCSRLGYQKPSTQR